MQLSELTALHDLPFFQLLDRARAVHRAHWPDQEVQLCTLLSIKTGGCSENCGYCSQSAHHSTAVERQPLLTLEQVMPHAEKARDAGSTRFCMGAAWKGVREGDGKFEQVLGIIRGVSTLGMEVCVTLGDLTGAEARKLREAGVTAYNHNIDTSPEHYANIVTTHSFGDRLKTIRAVQEADMAVCCGGILGMGESITDRLRMLEVLSQFNPPPESVPINCLMPVPGTPLEAQTPIGIFELVRMIATTRIAIPTAKVRLSAGRTRFSQEAQALCLYAGANSFFYGEKLLTAPNPAKNDDLELLRQLDLAPQAPFSDVLRPEPEAVTA